MKHPPTINVSEQMFSVWTVRDGTLMPVAKQNKSHFGEKKRQRSKKMEIFMEEIISHLLWPICLSCTYGKLEVIPFSSVLVQAPVPGFWY